MADFGRITTATNTEHQILYSTHNHTHTQKKNVLYSRGEVSDNIITVHHLTLPLVTSAKHVHITHHVVINISSSCSSEWVEAN